MATVTTDLVDLTLAESYSGDTSGVGGTWTVIGGTGGTGVGAGVDFSMQGTNAIDAKVSNTEKGPAITLGSSQTIASGEHIFTWAFVATPGLTDQLSARGLTVVVGTGTNNNYCQYHVAGNDTYGAAGRVGVCYPIDYSVRSSNTGSIPYRTVSGTPGANPTVFGIVANITSTVKSNNVACDAIRRGRGIFVTGGTSGAPATFSEVAASNDTVNNRWGVFTSLGGVAYEQQGYLVIGQDNTQTATAAYFSDAGTAITFRDTPHCASDFSRFVIDHASTTCILNGVSFAAAGTINKGQFIVQSNNPTVTLTGCSFVDIGNTTLQSNTTATSCAWRGCESVTQNTATIDTCSFIETNDTVALIANDVTQVTDCTFESSGTGYAIEGFSSAGSYDVSSNTFTNYGSTGTANAALHVLATTGSVTINAPAGTTYNSDGATVTIQSGQVTTTVTARDSTTKAAIQDARVYLVADTGGPLSAGTEIINALTNASGVASDTRSLASDQPVTGYVRKSSPGDDLYQSTAISGTISSTSGASLTALMISDE